jgi:hypothetical protein
MDSGRSPVIRPALLTMKSAGMMNGFRTVPESSFKSAAHRGVARHSGPADEINEDRAGKLAMTRT